jgi:hypothetical protein
METKKLLGIFLMLCIASVACLLPLASADTLTTSDFSGKGWSKEVDYFDFVGHPTVPSSWHAYTYMAFINTTGFQLLYAGLENITFGTVVLTIPTQTFIMHFKTENTSTDVVTASSFLTLLAFQDNTTAPGGILNSPDINDTLYASLNIGIDTPKFGNQTPSQFRSQTTAFPLTNSSDGTQWSWGMRYTNLTAIWYWIHINPDDPDFDERTPIAITRYSELQFTYNLTINKDMHRAVLTENHVIGRMTDLWLWTPSMVWGEYYNVTGEYGFFRQHKLSDTTIYQFLSEQKIKMSIVQYSTTVLLNQQTKSVSGTQNVTDSDVDVSDTSISTELNTGEKIFDASFGAKHTYELYNYTADPAEAQYQIYNATMRTVKIRGFALNGIFDNSTTFIRHLPLVVKWMDPNLYNTAGTRILNMTGANYFYIISYPTYSGFKVVQDPMYTMYYAPVSVASTTAPPTALNSLSITVGIVIVIAIVAVAVSLVMRRRMLQPQTRTQLQ